MPDRFAPLLTLGLLLTACATAPVPANFKAESHQQGPALGSIDKLFILYAQSDGYDPLRRQAKELALVSERQLRSQGYATTTGARQDADNDSLSSLQQAFTASGASHLMTISVKNTSTRHTGQMLSYTVEYTLRAPGHSSGRWTYRARQEDGRPETTAQLTADLIRAMQTAGMTPASSAGTTSTQRP